MFVNQTLDKAGSIMWKMIIMIFSKRIHTVILCYSLLFFKPAYAKIYSFEEIAGWVGYDHYTHANYLSELQKTALRAYKGGSFSCINGTLRKISNNIIENECNRLNSLGYKVDELIYSIESSITNSVVLPKDLVLFRGIFLSPSYGLHKVT